MSTAESLAQLDREPFLKGLTIRPMAALPTSDAYYRAHCSGYFCLERAHDFLTVSARHREHIPIETIFPAWVARKITCVPFTASTNLAFGHVLEKCAQFRGRAAGDGQAYTEDDRWMRDHTVGLLRELHAEQKAHSVDIWHRENLVGGAVGIQTGGVFISLSVFSDQPSAGYAAFVMLQLVLRKSQFTVHDAIMPSTLSRIFGGALVTVGDGQSVTQPAQGAACRWPSLAQQTLENHFPGFAGKTLAGQPALNRPSGDDARRNCQRRVVSALNA